MLFEQHSTMEDFELDLDELADLENLDCDWDTLDAIGIDPPSSSEQHSEEQVQKTFSWRHSSSLTSVNSSDKILPSVLTGSSKAATVTGDAQIHFNCEREGRCARCNSQTHQVQCDPNDSSQWIKIPLSIKGKVHRGRCLRCHPLPERQKVSSSQSKSSHQQLKRNRKSLDKGSLDEMIESYERPSSRRFSSAASLCTVNSEQSNPSIYSNHSAPVICGERYPEHLNHKLQIQGMKRESESYVSGTDFVERYQHQRHAEQGHKYADDGSVFSQVSQGTCHSHISRDSQAPFNFVPNHQLRGTMSPLQTSAHSRMSTHVSPQVIYDGFSPTVENSLPQSEHNSRNINDIILTMRNFPLDASIQEKGCAILSVETFNAEARSTPNIELIPVLLEAMKNHPHLTILQRSACAAICNLSILPLTRRHFFVLGGLTLIIETMKRHSDDPQILTSGCLVLAKMADDGVEYKVSVAENDGIFAVMNAVERHPENIALLRAAYQALRMLGYMASQK